MTARGKAREDGHPADVDREFVTMLITINENESWYLDENIQRFTSDPKGVNRNKSGRTTWLRQGVQPRRQNRALNAHKTAATILRRLAVLNAAVLRRHEDQSFPSFLQDRFRPIQHAKESRQTAREDRPRARKDSDIS
ncbi:MAG: hypothetical protein WAN14_24135, partial [Candidatus Acidiferrales bacterium]